jgi:hypothetical protein
MGPAFRHAAIAAPRARFEIDPVGLDATGDVVDFEFHKADVERRFAHLIGGESNCRNQPGGEVEYVADKAAAFSPLRPSESTKSRIVVPRLASATLSTARIARRSAAARPAARRAGVRGCRRARK